MRPVENYLAPQYLCCAELKGVSDTSAALSQPHNSAQRLTLRGNNHELILSSYFYGDAASTDIISYNSLNTAEAFNDNLYVGGSSNSIVDFPFCYAQNSYYYDNGPIDEFPQSPCIARFTQSSPINNSIIITNTENFSTILYPNPNKGDEFKIINKIIASKVVIKNVLGVEMYTLHTNNNIINGTSLLSGVYLITITDINGKIYNSKLIVL